MTGPVDQGQTPGALRPVMSGDGLAVRLRPWAGRLRRAHADAIATLAAAHGNGLIDLTPGGNLQIRGVSEDRLPALLKGLGAMSLLDPGPEAEARRNVLVTPFWQTGEETPEIADILSHALIAPVAPTLPEGFTFAVDTGRQPVLQGAPADIRLEQDAGGGLILCADGGTHGQLVTSDNIVEEALALAEWFVAQRGPHQTMAQVLAAGAQLPPGFIVPRQKQTYGPRPGFTPLGAMVGLAFGQLPARTLAALAKHGGLRLTPWRMLLVESARQLPKVPGVITDPADPLLRVVACTGAPDCPNGLARTRPLARSLAGQLAEGQFLHVSGCARGCAYPQAAALTVTATREGFNLVRGGLASDPPDASNLDAADLPAKL